MTFLAPPGPATPTGAAAVPGAETATGPAVPGTATAGPAGPVPAAAETAGRSRRLDGLLCLDDFEAAARAVLPPEVTGYVAGGSGAEQTLRANQAAFEQVRLLPRALGGFAAADPRTRLLGTELAMPVGIAPMAYQGLLHPDGELALARAARDAGVLFVASTLSSVTIERIAACGAATWFQLYWLRDRRMVEELVRRAEAAGCQALMLTVDVPRMGRRLRDIRAGFSLPADVVAANLPLESTEATRTGAAYASSLITHTARAFEPALSWAHVDWLRRRTGLPLVVKGILHPDDARRAVAAGVDAIVVSNHGGRQFDGAAPSIGALPAIRAAVGDQCDLLLDSGVRSGTDVLRALALGADAVLVGRPALWSLAVGGQAGAARLLEVLREEIDDALTLAGCPDPGAARALGAATGEPPATSAAIWSAAPSGTSPTVPPTASPTAAPDEPATA